MATHPPIIHCYCGGAATTECANCGRDVCAGHFVFCATCNEETCYYCTQTLPNDANFNCTTCVEKITGETLEDVVSGCPYSLKYPPVSSAAFNCFDPPIVTMTFADSRKARKLGIRPKNVQAEHIIPNSCFIRGSGRTGLIIPGGAAYSEGRALTYWVGDDQSHATEHKFLTDCERAFADDCVTNKKYPLLRDWLNYMETKTALSIYKFHNFLPPPGVIFANPAQHDAAAWMAAQEAAKALFQATTAHFVNVLGMKLDTPLAHGIVKSTQKVPTASSAKEIFKI
jgi:hypothetical protein